MSHGVHAVQHEAEHKIQHEEGHHGGAGLMEGRIDSTPLRRVGEPQEVAGAALLLAAPDGAFITGQNLVVDGGTTIGDGN